MRQAVLLLGLSIAPSFASQSPATPEVPAAPPVLQRFLERPAESLTEYRAIRHLEARNQRFKKHGWMDVVTELSPGPRFSYTVLDEGGSEYIRKKVLRPILDGERDVVANGTAARSALTADNYDLIEEQEIEPGVVRLLARPKRRDVTLIDGALFVTSDEADLVRISGRLAKSPSFWTKRVDVVRRYGRVAGVRVPIGVESTAHVRIAGASSLSMTYTYEMVNGVSVTDP